MKKFLSPAERGEMASVELVSKSEDGGCPPPPCHAPSRKLKPWFTRPGLFLLRGRIAVNIARLPELVKGVRRPSCFIEI